MSLQNILIISITLILTLVFSQLFVNVSRKIGYQYGSEKRERLAVVLTVIYAAVLSIFTRMAHPVFTVAGELYFGLFVLASIISISSSFIDLEYKEIPNSYNLATAVLGIAAVVIYSNIIDSAILSGGLMFGIYFILMMVTNAMGGGDVKMAGALGLLVPLSSFGTFLISPFAFGTVIAVYLIFVKKHDKNDMIAFGPYIAMGYLLTIFIYWAVL